MKRLSKARIRRRKWRHKKKEEKEGKKMWQDALKKEGNKN
jgi:hypothetical protein